MVFSRFISFEVGHGNKVRFWDIIFVWAVHDWELVMLDDFMNLIYFVKIRPEVEDRICWRI